MTPLHRAMIHVAGVAAWTTFWRRYYEVETGAAEVVYARTDDGWRLALSRYPPRGRPRRHPTLLVPGLGANRFGFDVDAGVSLARRLAAVGYDTWVLELRGKGLSEQPRPGGKTWGWSFDDFLLRDVPAAVAAVRERTGRDRLHWIGHSMGGLLLYAHLARAGSRDVRSAVTVGSSLTYHGTPSDFHALRRAQGLTRVLPAVPLGQLATFTAPLAARAPNRLEEFHVWPRNVDPKVVRRLNAIGFHPVSSPVLVQLATAMEPGGLRSADGSLAYVERLADARVPVLAIAGDRDRQCHPDAAARTLEALPAGVERELKVFGRSQGQAEHYGHFDLLIGPRAPREVTPAIEAWLDRHD